MKETEQLVMTPGPTNVPPRIMRAMIKPIIAHRGPDFEELYESILENLKYVFQTKNDVFVLTSSGTGGIECAVSNIIQSAKKIVIPVSGVFSQRLKETIIAMGGEPFEINVDWKRAVTMDMIEDVVKQQKDVKAIAVVYNETSTGTKINCMKEIGEFCYKHNLLFLVDAISILAGDYLPVDKWQVDICITGSQKCLMTPPGLVLLSISDKAWPIIEKNTNTFYFNLNKYRKFNERKQTPFTPAIPLFYALDEALKIIREEGLENVITRHKLCAEAFYKALEIIGLKPFAEKAFRSNTVIAVNNPPNINDSTIREILRKKHKIVIAGGQGKLKGNIFRIGVMGQISYSEVFQTINALVVTLSELGYEFKHKNCISIIQDLFKNI